MTPNDTDSACRAAFEKELCVPKNSQIDRNKFIEDSWLGITGHDWRAAWAACIEYHEFRIYNIEHRREFLQKQVIDLTAKAQGLVETLREFNRKFSPGDNWFPELRDALKNWEEK